MRITFKGTPYIPVYRGSHDGQLITVPAGGSVDLSDQEAGKLLGDFPGVFVADIVQAPVDRQIKEPGRRKRA
jgi:hypothetical protein